jgi:hypothetical protein
MIQPSPLAEGIIEDKRPDLRPATNQRLGEMRTDKTIGAGNKYPYSLK